MPLEELIRACAEVGDAAAWEEFVRRFHELIASVVWRTTRRCGSDSVALVQDLIQETYLKICADPRRLLAEFTPRHPEAFFGYLKVVTSNVVLDYFRGQRAHKRGSGRSESSIDEVIGGSDSTASATAEQDVHRYILMKEMDSILRASLDADNKERDLQIFWLYYRYGLSASAIAELPSVSLTVKGVESVLQRLKLVLCERVEKSSVSEL
jgi:RNA polymerase sigma-70 factor (ECF subfamily)